MPLRSFLKIDGENGDSGSFENDPGPNWVETSLSIDYNKISVTDQSATKHGIIGTPQTFAFDLSENKVATAVSSDIASSDIVSSAGLPAASAAVPVPASSPLHYFLKIDVAVDGGHPFAGRTIDAVWRRGVWPPPHVGGACGGRDHQG